MNNQKIHVLIIDDDIKFSSLLKQLLIRNNFIVLNALNTIEAFSILKIFYCDLIILDYMMPVHSGIDFLKKLRYDNINLPVIMLTAVNETDIKLQSLHIGADDYLSKPFLIEELILRIKNLIKRTRKTLPDYNITFSGMTFNTETQELYKDNELIPLSTLEMILLKAFVDNLGQVVKKEELLKKLGKVLTEENLNTLNVNIMRLRKKIESDNNKCLKTIRNQGFLLKP